MRLSVLVRLALQSILKNRMRAMLTMLGIIIGVAAVVVMVAVGYGARLPNLLSTKSANASTTPPNTSASETSSPARDASAFARRSPAIRF